MKPFGNLQEVPAPKHEWGLEEIDNNPCASVFAPPLPLKDAMEQLMYVPDHGERVRSLPPESRQTATHRIVQSILPTTATAQTYSAVSRLMPLALVGRNINDPNFFAWSQRVVRNFDKKAKTRVKVTPYSGPSEWGQVFSHPRCMLMCGKPGTGKTRGLQYILWKFFRNRLYGHVNEFGSFTQIPFLFIECSSLGSALGLVKEIIRAIAELVGYEPEYLSPSFKRGSVDDLIPEMVNLLLLYSVGPIFIDEAESIKSEQSGGNKALIQLWVRLVNESMTSIVLISNPDIETGLSKQFKARLRFSGGGTIRFDNLPMNSLDWQNYSGRQFGIQFTKVRTAPTPEIMRALHGRSQGILKLHGYLLEWTNNLAIEEGGDEQITVRLIDLAWRQNGSLVHKIINGIALTEEEHITGGTKLSSFAEDIDCDWLVQDGLVREVGAGVPADGSNETGSEAPERKELEKKITEAQASADDGEESEESDEPEEEAPSPIPLQPKSAATSPAVPADASSFIRCANDNTYRPGLKPYEKLVADNWMSSTEEFFP